MTVEYELTHSLIIELRRELFDQIRLLEGITRKKTFRADGDLDLFGMFVITRVFLFLAIYDL
jgi:hypothetical protein